MGKITVRFGSSIYHLSEEGAVRLVAHLLEQDTVAATRAATRIMVALQEQVLEQAA